MTFRAYVEHGFKLCPIREGEKRPRGDRWNLPENALTAAQADYASGAGLLHALSGTMALDIDNLDLARAYLAKEGIDLDALLAAPDAVQIVSGREGSAKLLYACPEPLPTKRIADRELEITMFELRCANTKGQSVQDLLPPSIHPSGRVYQWRYGNDITGDWRNLPPIPPALLDLWRKLIGPASLKKPAPLASNAERPQTTQRASTLDVSGADPALLATAHALLAQTDPDCDYATWLELGMALHGDLGEIGWALWDEWSAKGAKYPGADKLGVHWQSFGSSPNPITLAGLRRTIVATADQFDDLSAESETADPFDELHKARVAQFVFVHASEIVERPPTVWLVDDLLPKEDLSMLFGESGAGKSFLALDLSLAIARGAAWHGIETRQGPVCWIAAEAEGSMRGRLRAYAQTKMDGLDFTDVPFYVLGAGVNLADKEQMSALAEAAQTREPVLVVIDTLAAASAGADENSFESIGVILETCRHMHRTTSATVLLIHHAGKDVTKGARGHSSLKAAMHAELCVSRLAEGGRELKITKLRDGIDGKRWSFDLQSVTIGADDRGKPLVSASVTSMAPIKDEEQVKGDSKGKRTPKGLNESFIWRLFLEMTPISGQPVDRDVLISEALRRGGVPPSEVPKMRSAYTRSLRALQESGYLLLDGAKVSINETDFEEIGEDDASDLL